MNGSSRSTRPAAADAKPVHPHRGLVVLGLMLGMFLAAMEATAVSTAMPTVIGDLGGVELYSWVFTAYMLTSTLSVPVYGKLSDLFGRKPIIMLGLGLFLLGSTLSGVSTSLTQLILFRALQGLGAGAVQTTALTVIGDLFTLQERAKIQAFFASVWGVAGVSGPLLGGLIVKYLSWRWVFYINVPFGIASAVLLVAFFRENVVRRPVQLDWRGALLLTAGTLALLTAAGGIDTGPLLLVAAALLGLFVAVERRASDAILPLALFAKRLMWVASISGALAGAAMFSIVTYLPLYVQGATGGSPTEAGSALMPMMVGWPVASAFTGKHVARHGFRRFFIGGLALVAMAGAFMAIGIARSWSLPALAVAMAAFGIGMGGMNTSMILAVQTSVDWKERGVATASTLFFRTIGGTLAVGALGGMLAHLLAEKESLSTDEINLLLGPEHGHSLAPQALAHLASALHEALVPIFIVVAIFAVLAAVAGLAFPKTSPAHTGSQTPQASPSH